MCHVKKSGCGSKHKIQDKRTPLEILEQLLNDPNRRWLLEDPRGRTLDPKSPHNDPRIPGLTGDPRDPGLPTSDPRIPGLIADPRNPGLNTPLADPRDGGNGGRIPALDPRAGGRVADTPGLDPRSGGLGATAVAEVDPRTRGVAVDGMQGKLLPGGVLTQHDALDYLAARRPDLAAAMRPIA